MNINQKYILSREKILAFCFFLSMLISVWAVRTPHSTLGSDFLRIVVKYIFYILLIVEYGMGLTLYKNIKIQGAILVVALFPVLYWVYIHIWAYEMESLAITSPLIAFIFAMQNNVVKEKTYIFFKHALIFIALMGILCYGAYILKLRIPYSISPYYDGRPYHNYVNYFNIIFIYINDTSVRLCGIYNEPGWLGTTIALFLCYEKFDFKKVSNWILLVAGALSYSLAFVLIIIIGWIIRNLKNVNKWIPIIIFGIIAIFVLPKINTNSVQLNALISRMKITSAGLNGNNRSSATIDALLKQMLFSLKGFWGYGDGYAEYLNSINESKQILTIKTELVNFGIIGTLILYAIPFFFFLKLSLKSKKAIIFVICFWISLYQRPWLYIVSNYMLLLAITAHLNKENMLSQYKY